MIKKYDSNNNIIYEEQSEGSWIKYQYDKNNNLIYKEFDDCDWWEYKNGITIDHGRLNRNYPQVSIIL